MPVQGYYGTESNPYANLYSERIVLTPRLSDPSNPSQGDWWFRYDLDSGNSIGTVRWYDGTTKNDTPVFPTGDSFSGVQEVLRIQTPDGAGFVPVTSTSPTYPQLALQHGGTRHGWHTGQGTSIIDDFEDGNISEYSGDTGQFTTQTTTVKNGTTALDGTSDGGMYYITSTSGLNYYPQPGDVFHFWLNTDSSPNNQASMLFGLPSESTSPSGYAVRLDAFGDSFILYRYDSGSRTLLDGVDYTFSASTWYEAQIYWGTDGTIQAILYDNNGVKQTSVGGVDSTYTSQGIGWRVNNGGSTLTTTFDYAYAGGVTGFNTLAEFKPNYQYATNSPYDAQPHPDANNPVLTVNDVTDSPSTVIGVADPFIWPADDGTWHMMLEIINSGNAIAHATSADGVTWTYDQIVIDQYSSESFPYIFQDPPTGQVYLASQGNGSGNTGSETVVYEKGGDWTTWTEVNSDLFELSVSYGDTPLWYGGSTGIYWSWVSDYTNDNLRLFYNEGDFATTADWTEHPSSPIRTSGYAEAGAAFLWDTDTLALFTTDNIEMVAHEVTTLTKSSYSETAIGSNPVLNPSGNGDWRDSQMHTFGAWWNGMGNEDWLIVVDGQDSSGTWSIGMYTA